MKTIKFKKLLSNAETPKKSTTGAAGYDLIAISWQDRSEYIEYDTGIAFEIPEGYVGLLFPRSSVSNTSLILANSVGVIDSDYRGSIKFRFKKVNSHEKIYLHGDKIGQIVFVELPKIELQEVDELTDTERSDKGFGSTGA